MLDFLRDLLRHCEWANAVYFHTWGKSTARDHEELRRRMEHILGVQQGFLAVLRGDAAGGPPDRPPLSYDELKPWAVSVHGALNEFAASLDEAGPGEESSNPLDPRSAVHADGFRGDCAGGHAHAASSRAVHDAAQGFRRRAKERRLAHLAVERKAGPALGLTSSDAGLKRAA